MPKLDASAPKSCAVPALHCPPFRPEAAPITRPASSNATLAPDRASAFLIEPGDNLRFEPIDAHTFAALDARAEAGEVVATKKPL